jgi:acetyl esterase/lipase
MVADSRTLDRRALLALAGGATMSLATSCAATAVPLGSEVVRLWPDRAPGWTAPIALQIKDEGTSVRPERGITGVGDPMLIVCRAARPNGTGVLVIPGGSYVWESFDNEGMRQAAWLNARGITAFVLVYRLPAEGWARQADVPLQDAQRAIRLIRAGAARFNVARDRLAVLGFSAGGHLAGSLATRFAERVYEPVDAVDRESARPDIAAMLYPVVTMRPGLAHAGSRDALIGKSADAATIDRYSVEHRVGADTPPVFLAQSADDATVPIQNSLLMYQAMLAARRSVAMHLFETGGHGFGVNLPATEPAHDWPELFLGFAAAHGLGR